MKARVWKKNYESK